MCNNGCKSKKCKFYSYFYTYFNTYDKGKLHEMCFYNEKKPDIIWNKETQDCPLDNIYIYHAIPKDSLLPGGLVLFNSISKSTTSFIFSDILLFFFLSINGARDK